MATAVSEAFDHGFPMRKGLADAYRPSANEEFMNAAQLAFFRQKLLKWKV